MAQLLPLCPTPHRAWRLFLPTRSRSRLHPLGSTSTHGSNQQHWNRKAADPNQNGRECGWVAEVYLHQVSFHLMSFSHEHVCAFVLKLSTATTHTSKHDTIQWGLQSSFLPGAGMREQLLMLVFGVGRTVGKCLGSLSAGGEWRYQTDKLLDHGRPCCLRLDMHW